MFVVFFLVCDLTEKDLNKISNINLHVVKLEPIVMIFQYFKENVIKKELLNTLDTYSIHSWREHY